MTRTHVRREQAECYPTLEHGSRRKALLYEKVVQHRRADFALRRHDSHLETADIVRPKGESGAGQAETSSK